MVTEPLSAARPRGTTFVRLLAGTAAVTVTAACLAGCSSKAVSVVGALSSSGSATGSPSASAAASAADVSPAARSTAASTSAVGNNAIPASAWIASRAVPLNGSYHWSAPASAAKAAESPVLSAVQDCQLSLSSAAKSELGAFPAAQADLRPTSGATGGQDDWSAQETILATGDTSSGDIQGIYGLYTDLVAALGTCAHTAPGAKLSGVTGQGPAYAATITIPTSTGTTLTWHEYLAAPYGYLVELSVWVAPYAGDKPSAAWDGSSTTAVLSALQAGPCAVTKLC